MIVAVSLSYVCLVSLVPAHDRPYVDGSCNNSIVSQVFQYNGADRLSAHSLDRPGLLSSPDLSHLGADDDRRGDHGGAREGTGTLPRWTARARRRLVLPTGPDRADRDPRRPPQAARDRPVAGRRPALGHMAGLHLGLLCVLALSQRLLPGRVLVPPLGALCGLGVALAWRHRSSAVVRLLLMATVVVVVAYAVSLLVPNGAGLRGLIIGSGIVLGLAAVLALAPSLAGADRRGSA